MASVRLSDEQGELIKALAAAYAQPGERTGQKESIVFYTAAGGTDIQHPGLPDGAMRVSLGDLEEFDSYGWIDIRYGKSDYQGSFRVTNDGYDAVEQIDEQEKALAAVVPAEGVGMGFDWNGDVLPVLQTVEALWKRNPSSRGVTQAAVKQALGRADDDMHTSVVLRKLQEADFIQGKGAWQGEGPMLCEPTTKAFEYLSGWPSDRGDMALARLIEAVEARIEATSDPNEKSKLKRLRDSLTDVPQRVMTSVLTDIIVKGGGGVLG